MSANTERLERMAVGQDNIAATTRSPKSRKKCVARAAWLRSLIPLVETWERAHKPCARCGKPVCILEDGGPGAELADGRWVCSEECWDALAGPPETPSVVKLHGLWRTDMENAPLDTPLAIRAGGMTFDARLQLLDNGDKEPTYGWVADREGIHPQCWTNGRCWDLNENNEPSAKVTHWQPLPPPPEKGGAS